MTIYEYFFKWDPVGLIQQGSQSDEYNREAFELEFWYGTQKGAVTKDDISKKLDSIFEEWLGVLTKEAQTDNRNRSDDILKILEEGNKEES